MEHDPEMAVSLSQSITACKSKKSLGLLAEVALYRHYEEQQQITEDNESDRLISPPKTKVSCVLYPKLIYLNSICLIYRSSVVSFR